MVNNHQRMVLDEVSTFHRVMEEEVQKVVMMMMQRLVAVT